HGAEIRYEDKKCNIVAIITKPAGNGRLMQKAVAKPWCALRTSASLRQIDRAKLQEFAAGAKIPRSLHRQRPARRSAQASGPL
ncbi:hypothetical protein R0K04_27485, partial [Pseudoalteromonas sp. SIMBA_153]